MQKLWMRLAALTLATALSILLAATSSPAVEGMARARPAQPGLEIRLQRASFDPLAGMPALPSGLVRNAPPAGATTYYLVQFRGPIEAAWRADLERQGAVVIDYVPQFAYIVRMDGMAASRVQDLEAVRWVGLYQPAYRLSTDLDAVIAEAEPGKRAALLVRSFPGEPADALAGKLKAAGAEIQAVSDDSGGGTLFQIECPAASIDAVAQLDAVAWLEPEAEPHLDNAVARSNLIFGKDAVEADLGLYGAGQVVVVGDTGVSTGNASTMHPDFQGHFYQGSTGGGSCTSWSDYYGHGTHVAGSVLGNGLMDGSNPAAHSYGGTNAGIAPEAGLWAWAFCDDWSGLPDLDPYNDYFGVMYGDSSTVRVNTNSWGYEATPGTYDSFSRETDRFIWDHPDMVVLFAASNDGVDGNGDGIVDSGSLGVPAGAKNVVTVGASEDYRMTGGYNPGGACSTWGSCWPSDYPANPVNNDRLSDDPLGMVAFSSRGPTLDGRLKPDVVAPGSNVVSTRYQGGSADPLWGVYNEWYSYCGGTSMATPLAAGASAIVREFYQTMYGLNPSAALVKATLINGARDMTPGQYRDEVPNGSKDDVLRRPDINQGWGRIDLPSSLVYTLPHTLWFEDGEAPLETGEEYVTYLTVIGDEHPLRVTLAWADYPGTEATNGALVNDLDLEVLAPGGMTYYGNDRIGDGLLDGDVDHVNNVEGVDLVPVPGHYTIRVNAYNTPQGPQAFALVVSADLGSVGHLQGTVYDGTVGGGLAAASLQMVTGTVEYGTTTEASGTYSLPMAADTYTVSAWKYGYSLQTVTNVAVISGTITTQDFTLTQMPPYSLTGCVTDATTGQPLSTTISILGPFGDLVAGTTAPQTTGCYDLSLPGGPYTVRAESRLHGTGSAAVNLAANTVQDFALTATTTDGLLWGHITNVASGDPVEGATVEVTPGGTSTTSAADGGYEVQVAPGTYTVTVSAPLYSTVTESDVTIPQSNLVQRDYGLPTAHMVLLPPGGVAVSLRAGQEVTATLVISNSGQGGLDFEVAERSEGFQPAVAGEEVLVVNRISDDAAADLEAALATLGHSYVEVDDTTFQGTTVDDLLTYDLIVWAGSTGSVSGSADNANEVQLMAYLDAGGALLQADNDLGYFRHGSNYYDNYLHAVYGLDDATDTDSSPQWIEGLDLMAPLMVDLTTDPYPDGVAPRDASAVPVFEAEAPADANYPWVGLAVAGGAYRVAYLAFDFQYVAGADVQAELVERAYDWLANTDVPWLATDPISGSVPPGEVVSVTLTCQPDLLAAPGTYQARLRIKSNDPGAQPWTEYPVEMYVLPPKPVLSLAKTPSADRIDAGMTLSYTIVVSNDGGPATGVVISDSLPANTILSWIGAGGAPDGDDVVWSDLTLPTSSTVSVTYGVTVSCVTSGTEIVNDHYQVIATEWPTPTLGASVIVTAATEGPQAGFGYGPLPPLVDWPVQFFNQSENALVYEWDLGDGEHTSVAEPVHVYGSPPAEYTVVLTASNGCDSDVAEAQLSVGNYALAAGPLDQSSSGDAGQVVRYTLAVTNTGTLSDVVGLSLAMVAWPTELSTDSLALEAGDSATVIVSVTVPLDVPGDSQDTVRVSIDSLLDPRPAPAPAEATLTTTSNPTYSVRLGPASATLAAGAGQTVTYTLVVTNTSNVVDVISFSRVQPGWPTSFSLESQSIAAGGWRTLEVYVTVPPGITGGEQDVATIRATGSGGHADVVLTTVTGQRRVYLPLVVRNNGP
jgi:uncharacterized repeat protein (TIGR01451 family)